MARILVVDDEPVCTYFLSCALGDEGHEVRTSLRGDEAIAIGREFRPDILISDWMLKDQYDGLDVGRALTEDNPDLKVIFITGLAEETLRDKANGFSFLKILEKPVDLDEMITLVKVATGVA
jgi:two-component system, OmpR family, response regulator